MLNIVTQGFEELSKRLDKVYIEMNREHILPVAKEIRDYVKEMAKTEAPVGKTGQLKESIYGRTSVQPEGVYVTVAIPKRIKYAGWVLKGRGWVFPVKKKALWWPGLPHPVAYARPSKANPFMMRAKDKAMPEVRRMAGKIGARVTEAIVKK